MHASRWSTARTRDTRQAPAELLHEGIHCRVSRLFMAGGTVIRKEPLGPGAPDRLRRETRMLTLLAGVAGVPQLADVATWPGSILVEDVWGTPLSRAPLPMATDRLLEVARELARTLGEIHHRGVVHRDISPTNILLGSDERAAYLIDFAVATSLAEIRPQFAHGGAIVGTLPYLAPELTGRTGRPVDHRADLYALGAVLYELATGAPPFGRGDPLRVSYDHLTRQPVPPARSNPSLPPAVSDIILRLLTKEPDNRYQSASGVLHDIDRTIGRSPAPDAHPVDSQDLPLRPQSLSHLVGRDVEVARLAGAFAAVGRGAHQHVLVSGPAGVGKTALLNELRPIVTKGNGWFVAGMFDPDRLSHEMDGVWQAFDSLGHLLLAEESQHQLRQRLDRALGSDTGTLAAVQPTFAKLLETEPDRTVGDAATLPARLERIGVEILRAVASPARPLVLVLDDLQWASRTALSFIDRVMHEEGLDGLLLAGAYRSESLDASRPLTDKLVRWRQSVPVQHLTLENLPLAGTASLLREMLRLDSGSAAELAALLQPRSKGNPYDLVEIVSSLLHDQLLVAGEGGWTWDRSALTAHLQDSDVTAMLMARIQAMPRLTRGVLQTLACLGVRVELDVLESATGLSAAELELRLAGPLRDGLLVMEPGVTAAVRVRHETVQQVILRRMERRRTRALRLRLARRLASHADHFTAAAEQYLTVVDAVQHPQERSRVIDLFQRAADEAELLSNHMLVSRCMAGAATLIDVNDPVAMMQVQTRRHAALYNLGHLDEADEIYEELADRNPGVLAYPDATLVQVSSLTNRNRPREAAQLGLRLLRELGFPAPAVDDLDAVIDDGLNEIYRWVDDSDATDDLRRPEITDPRLLTVGAAIDRLIPPAFLHDEMVHAWLVVQAWRIWQSEGPARTLVGPISQTPLVTVRRGGDHRAGHRVLQRLVAVGESRGYELETAQCRHLLAVTGWSLDPLEKGLRLARQGREKLIRGGELQNACFTYGTSVLYLLECGPSLDRCQAEVTSALSFADRTGNTYTAEYLSVYRRLVDVLRGSHPASEASEIVWHGANRPALVAAHLTNALVAALNGDQAELAAQSKAVMPLLPAVAGLYLTALAHVLRALALAEQTRVSATTSRDAVVAELDRQMEHVAALSSGSPVNFLHLLRLLEAERAWVDNDFRSASYAFDAAIRAAAPRHRPWHRALILERAARFYLAHGMEHIAFWLLAEARRGYLAWGATTKVDHLDWVYPTLTTGPAAPSDPTAGVHNGGAAGRSRLMRGNVDLVSILAGSQALSSETSIEGLHTRVTQVLGGMTGATQIHLLLWNDAEQTWLVIRPNGPRTVLPLDEAGQASVPISVVRYLQRTTEPLVVDDATRDDRFRRDPYLSLLERCSLLGVLIRGQGTVRALLVLENRLIRRAFTADRLDVVVLMAGQLAVSLQNAIVYASLEQEVAKRTEELARANERWERLSVTDALTGLSNRRRLAALLASEWHRARRASAPIAAAMIDIDEFKLFNDAYGHAAGDRCLRQVASLLRGQVGDPDLAARYGGDEFVVVMPGIDLDAACAAAEELRAAVVALGLRHKLAITQEVTVSIGVAAAVAAHTGPDDLIEAADARLYQAKRHGRNRVMPSVTG